jgi:hypothetical protein
MHGTIMKTLRPNGFDDSQFRWPQSFTLSGMAVNKRCLLLKRFGLNLSDGCKFTGTDLRVIWHAISGWDPLGRLEAGEEGW